MLCELPNMRVEDILPGDLIELPDKTLVWVEAMTRWINYKAAGNGLPESAWLINSTPGRGSFIFRGALQLTVFRRGTP